MVSHFGDISLRGCLLSRVEGFERLIDEGKVAEQANLDNLETIRRERAQFEKLLSETIDLLDKMQEEDA